VFHQSGIPVRGQFQEISKQGGKKGKLQNPGELVTVMALEDGTDN
jgi:hypothetical protein